MDVIDFTKDGVPDIIVCRDDGDISVYGFDASEVPMEQFNTNIGESIRSVRAGRVCSPQYDEMVVCSFSGRVTSYTMQPLSSTADASDTHGRAVVRCCVAACCCVLLYFCCVVVGIDAASPPPCVALVWLGFAWLGLAWLGVVCRVHCFFSCHLHTTGRNATRRPHRQDPEGIGGVEEQGAQGAGEVGQVRG